MFEVLTAIYILLALVAVRFTYLEQKKAGIVSPMFLLIGYTLCLVWPFMTLIFASMHVLRRA